jgi:hypothetical protein
LTDGGLPAGAWIRAAEAMALSRPARFPRHFVPRLLLGLSATLALATLEGPALVHAVLPAVRTLWHALQPDYRLLDLDLQQGGQEAVVRLRLTLARPLVLAGRVVMPDPRGWLEVRAPLNQFLQVSVAGLTGVLCGVGLDPRRIGCMALICAVMLPLDLYVSLAALVSVQVHAQPAGALDWAAGWTAAQQAAGRPVLALLLAWGLVRGNGSTSQQPL